jgi:acetate kinase
MDTILVIDAGSSQLRFRIYSVEGEGSLRQQVKGRIDGVARDYKRAVPAAIRLPIAPIRSKQCRIFQPH